MKGKKFWQFKAQDNNSSVGELMLYGDISEYSWWDDDVTPKQFKEDLDALGDISELKIYINSGGGDVFAGQAIHSMLKRHSATKTVYIDGLAASIASVIAMAGDKIIMPKNAMMMIHKCWTLAIGNADDMRKMADDMDKIDESIIAAYVEKTGLDAEDIIELMTDETWMTAQDALDYGFADEIEESKQVAASMKNGMLLINGQEMDLSRFQNVPEFPKVKKPTRARAEPPVPEPKVKPDDQAVQIAKAKLMLELEL
jgi:ATP-dependent Clp protease protease subunit